MGEFPGTFGSQKKIPGTPHVGSSAKGEHMYIQLYTYIKSFQYVNEIKYML